MIRPAFTEHVEIKKGPVLNPSSFIKTTIISVRGLRVMLYRQQQLRCRLRFPFQR